MESITKVRLTPPLLWLLKPGGVVFVGVVVCVVSAGPVWWIHKHGLLSKAAFATIYQPVGFMIENSPDDVLFRYVSAPWEARMVLSIRDGTELLSS